MPSAAAPGIRISPGTTAGPNSDPNTGSVSSGSASASSSEEASTISAVWRIAWSWTSRRRGSSASPSESDASRGKSTLPSAVGSTTSAVVAAIATA